jgi:hypothetical protein
MWGYPIFDGLEEIDDFRIHDILVRVHSVNRTTSARNYQNAERQGGQMRIPDNPDHVAHRVNIDRFDVTPWHEMIVPPVSTLCRQPPTSAIEIAGDRNNPRSI